MISLLICALLYLLPHASTSENGWVVKMTEPSGLSHSEPEGLQERSYTVTDNAPEQIHLSFSGNGTEEITVTWVTFDPTPVPVVRYGLNWYALNKTVPGFTTLFTDGGSEHRSLYIHRVRLYGLQHNAHYYYRVGSYFGLWSQMLRMRTAPAGDDWSPRVIVYGDIGAQPYSTASLGLLQLRAYTHLYDAYLHIGDIGYNLDAQNGRTGDLFMRKVQPVASYLPYMTTVGNHEQKYNFSNYHARFSMPRWSEFHNMFYSFNMGMVHFVAFSSEAYYPRDYGTAQIQTQYNFLAADLEEANRPENRARRPWIVAIGHRPMYCSNTVYDCDPHNNPVRQGRNGSFILEELFYSAGVDLVFTGHQHCYERHWPVYNNTVCNGSLAEPYTNSKAPVHIVTGSPGCCDQSAWPTPFLKHPYPWSAFRNQDFSVTDFNIVNRTHLHLVQYSTTQPDVVIDDFWLIRTSRGADNKPVFNCSRSSI